MSVAETQKVRWMVALLLVTGLLGFVARAESRSERTARLRAELRVAEQSAVDGNDERAEAAFRRIVTECDAAGERTLLLARALDGQADALRRGGRREEAEPLYRRSIELWESLLGMKQPRLATSLHNLGTVYLDLGRPDEAQPVFERALTIWETTFGPESDQAKNTRRALRNVARARR